MVAWYCYVGGKRYGPVEKQVLEAWAREGRLSPADLVWSEGMPQWAPASSVPGLLATAPPPIPSDVLVPAHRPGGTGGRTPNAELTEQALVALSGRWGLAIGFSLLLFLLGLAASSLPYVGALAGLILGGPFAVSGAVFYLTYTRRGPAELGMLFAGFKNFANALAAYLLVLVFVLLWTLLLSVPGILLLIVLAVRQSENPLAWAVCVLAFVPGMVALVIAQLRYSQTFFLLADERSLGVMEAIRGSNGMMRGREAKLFCIWLRFFGWSLLCLLTCGIGYLWLWPYMGAVTARFFDDLAGPVAVQATPAAAVPPGP